MNAPTRTRTGVTPVRFPRGRRAALSTITAVVLLAIAVAVGYLAVLKALDRTVSGIDLAAASRRLGDTGFADVAVLITGIAVGAVGLLLLAVALLPTSRHLVELTGPDEHTAAALKSASLRRTVQSAARKIDGISQARARIGSRRIGLEVTSGLRHTEGLTARVEAAAYRRLADLDLRRTRIVKTRLSRKES